jgi:succinate dehydrogenase hydrophobic anchor subunit
VIVAVGAGTIMDFGRYPAYKLGIPFVAIRNTAMATIPCTVCVCMLGCYASSTPGPTSRWSLRPPFLPPLNTCSNDGWQFYLLSCLAGIDYHWCIGCQEDCVVSGEDYHYADTDSRWCGYLLLLP